MLHDVSKVVGLKDITAGDVTGMMGIGSEESLKRFRPDGTYSGVLTSGKVTRGSKFPSTIHDWMVGSMVGSYKSWCTSLLGMLLYLTNVTNFYYIYMYISFFVGFTKQLRTGS